MTPPPKKKIFYEVYDNRAILEPIDDLVLLDRDTNKLHAIEAAKEWAGCVIRVECLVFSADLHDRRILSTQLIYFFRPAEPDDSPSDLVHGRDIRGQITRYMGPDTTRRKRRR